MNSRTDKIIRKRKISDLEGLCDYCGKKSCPDSKSSKPKRNHGQKPRYKNKAKMNNSNIKK